MDTSAYITRNARICGGEPVFTGTRVLVRTVLLTFADGDNEAKILADFPTLTREHLRAAIAFAARALRDGPPGDDMLPTGVPRT
jgi:uncharacterized protein (DUF433 family)